MSDLTGGRDEFTHAMPTAEEGENRLDSQPSNISHVSDFADATTSPTLPLTFANHTAEGPRGLLSTPRSAGSLFSSPHSELVQRNSTGTSRLDRSPHFLIGEGMCSACRPLSSFTAAFSSPCNMSSRGEGRHTERNCRELSAKDLQAGGGAGMPPRTNPLVLSQFGVPQPPEAHEMSATTARSATTLRSRLGPNVTKPLSEVLGVSDASYFDGMSVEIFPRKELWVSCPGSPASYEGSGWGGADSTKDHVSPPPLAAAVPGLHTDHRTLADPLLNDIFDFLSRVGEELKQIALLKTTEDGEFFLMGEPHHAEAQPLTAAIANSPPHTPRARTRRTGGGSMLMSREHSNILFQQELTGERWLHKRSFDTGRSASPMSNDYLAVRVGLQSISTVPPSEMPPSTLAGYPLLNVGDLVPDENPAKQLGMSRLLPFPLYSVNNGFSFRPEWFSELPELGNGAAAHSCQPAAACFAGDREVVTAEPLIFRAGMLQDPISGCFLLGGAAFREEVRVLKAKTVKGTVCHMTAATLFGQASTQWSKASSPWTPAARPRSSKIGLNGNAPSSGGRILLREYLSVSKFCGVCVVQTLSILHDSVTVNASRHQILAPDVARRLLEDTLPGAVTRLFIQPNARGMTHNQALRPFSLCSPRPPPGVSDTTADRAAAFDKRQSVTRHRITSIDSSTVNPHPTKSDGSSFGASNKRSDRSHIMTSSEALRQEGSPLLQYFNTSRPSRWSSEAKRRVLVGEEATLADTNPALLEWAMHRDPSALQESIDNIRAFLEYYRTTYATMMVVRGLLTAVRRLQAFVRRCLARKKRCVKRMLQIWRSLEVESRIKLHYYHPPSSSLERVELIASNLLEQHMITSHEHKQKIIEELWEERRQNYRAWQNEKGLDNYVRVARRPRSTITDESSLSSAVGRLSPGPPARLQANSLALTPLDPDNALPPTQFSVTTQHEGGAIEPTLQSYQKLEAGEAYTCEAEPHVSSTLSYKAFRMPRKVECSVPPWMGTGRALSATRVTAWVRGVRMDSEFHKRFGWYIAPEHLLYVSHQRLLESLKISILSIEQVQYEVERAANENKERSAHELRQQAAAAGIRRNVPGCPRLPRIVTNNSAYRKTSRSVATTRSALLPKERSSVMNPISCLTENTSQLAMGESQKFALPHISNCRDRIHE